MKYTFTLTLSLFIILTYGQSVQKPLRQKLFPKKEIVNEIVGTSSDAIYIVNRDAKDFAMTTEAFTYYLTKMDKQSFKTIWKTKVSQGVLPTVFLIRENVYAVGGIDKGGKLSIGIYGFDNTGNPYSINEFDTWFESKAINDFARPLKSYTYCSNDSSKVLVVLSQVGNWKVDEEILARVYDTKTMSFLWESKLPALSNGNNAFHWNYKIDNEGNIYYLQASHTGQDKTDLKVEFAKMDNSKKVTYKELKDINSKINPNFSLVMDKSSKNGVIKLLNDFPSIEFEVAENEIQIATVAKNNLDGDKNDCNFLTFYLNKGDLKVIRKSEEQLPQEVSNYLLDIKKKGTAEFEYAITKMIKFSKSSLVVIRPYLNLNVYDNSASQVAEVFLFLDGNGKIKKAENFANTNFLWVGTRKAPFYTSAGVYYYVADLDLKERKRTVKGSSPVFANISMEPEDNLFVAKLSENGIEATKCFQQDKGFMLRLQPNNFVRGTTLITLSSQDEMQYKMELIDF